MKYSVKLTLIVATFLLSSCDDMFKKEINVDGVDTYSKLYVVAAIDHLSGSFNCHIGMTTPIVHQGDIPKELGTFSFKLYENENLILDIDTFFVYKSFYFLEYLNIYHTAGNKYRLEVSSNRFDDVYSEIVSPEMPIIGNVHLDDDIVYRNPSKAHIYDWSSSPGAKEFKNLNVEFSDIWPTRDYFSFRTETIGSVYTEPIIGTTDYVMVQDNPNVEVWGFDTEINTYLFGDMIISDYTFANKTSNLQFIVPSIEELPYGYAPLDYWLARGYTLIDLYEIPVTMDLIVSHLSSDMFKYYRTLIIQGEYSGFQGEPVEIKSNITNGYGCFFAITSKTVRFLEQKLYVLRY